MRQRHNDSMTTTRRSRRNPPVKLTLKAKGDTVDIFTKVGRVVVGRMRVEKLDPYYGRLEDQLTIGGCAQSYQKAWSSQEED